MKDDTMTGLPDYWTAVDGLAVERGMDPPSDRHQLVARVAWGIHASRGLPSPRQAWADMPAQERIDLFLAAAGAIAAYEPVIRQAGLAVARASCDEAAYLVLDAVFPHLAPHD